MEKLTRIEGFSSLTTEEKLSILNDSKNFVGLTRSANASKGKKSYAEWTMHISKGIKVNEKFRQDMIKREKELEQYFLEKVASMLDS